MLVFDHFAIAAQTLDEGRAWVEEALGVTLQKGGQHAHFGTHNLLLGMGQDLYLEVIAIDPDAPAPNYPRWFDLDRFQGRPRISNWICRTKRLQGALDLYPGGGRAVDLVRGDLRWQMAVPENGILPYDNMFPALIEWHGDLHPAQMLANSGCELCQLTVHHPEADRLNAELAGVLHDKRVVFEVGPIALSAEIKTPHGLRRLG